MCLIEGTKAMNNQKRREAMPKSRRVSKPQKHPSLVRSICPPESGFYSKVVDYQGIPIKSSDEVDDRALLEAWQRLHMMLRSAPSIVANLIANEAELHIIGKDQVTSDLPENRQMKGKPFDKKLTIDQRTRGTGGLASSCGEENLLKLPNDRYFGRDICVHEFAHTIRTFGVDESTRRKIGKCFVVAREKRLWPKCYAMTNEDEYFSELCMWYFGTHGDPGKISPQPMSGPMWLQSYDTDAFHLLDNLFSGRLEVEKWALRPLKRLSITKESTLRSTSGDKNSIIEFVNQTEQPMKLYWLDYNGKRIFKWLLEPLGRHTHYTYKTHPFVVTDTDENAKAIFVAQSYCGMAIIQTE